MTEVAKASPMFSIGVTSYNRIDLLKQTLDSLLAQDCGDFEIIVGNDYLAGPLTSEILGVNDSRVIIINQPVNLGERENMNSLLKAARGRYFTWVFDDDLCAPTFLSESQAALKKYGFPTSLYTSFQYIYGLGEHEFASKLSNRAILYTGREFLRQYLSGAIRVMGLGGFHSTEYLRSLGGAEKLSETRMALNSEYLMIFKDGLQPGVVYLTAPLVASRVHGGSWSCNSAEVDFFKQGGINLLRESLVIFSNSSLKPDFQMNLTSLLKSVISVFVVKRRLAGAGMQSKELSEYLNLIEREFLPLRQSGLYEVAIVCLRHAKRHLTLFRIKAIVKVMISERYLKYAHMAVSLVSRYSNKSF